MTLLSQFLFISAFTTSVLAHAGFFHPSMWGFNVTDGDFNYDNRPVAPLFNRPFNEWWFHNHLAFPPHPEDRFLLPAGSSATAEIACAKGATSFFDGTDFQQGNNPCPNSETIAIHSHNIEETEGCALAIAYKSNVDDVQPEDFTVFSVNHTCVWTRFTEFQVPKRMPPCPEGGCICAFFWVHNENGGGSENYMNGFRCDVTGAEVNADVKVTQGRVPRRCGVDQARLKFEADEGNCTYGAKTPFYWIQAERNNMFEPPYTPPVYNDRYAFPDGAQEDIFEDSYVTNPLPVPRPGGPVPVLRVFDNAPIVLESSASSPTSTSASPSSTAQPTSDSVPTFTPQRSCRPRFKGLPVSLSLTKRSNEVEDCTASSGANSTIGLFGRKLYSYSRRGRRGVHPREAEKLWKLW